MVWFQVKQEKSFTKGPQILFDVIQEIRKIDVDGSPSGIVFPVLERNAFVCLGENFLASLLYSDKEHHRRLAVQKILSIRSQPAGEVPVPVAGGRIPKLNFEAREWSELVGVEQWPAWSRPVSEKFQTRSLSI
jgi:hypothetical protein